MTAGAEHAHIDGEEYKARGWGALAYGASLAIGPLFGGGGVVLAAYAIEPDIWPPSARLTEAQNTYEEYSDVLLYRTEYQETIAGYVRRERARRAWIGTGLGVATYAVIAGALFYVWVIEQPELYSFRF